MVVVGGVIPPQDYPELYAAGAKAIFGPGTPIADAAIDLLAEARRQGGRQVAAGCGVDAGQRAHLMHS